MAVITFHHLAEAGPLSPGETHHWHWNNAGREKVWAFGVDDEVSP